MIWIGVHGKSIFKYKNMSMKYQYTTSNNGFKVSIKTFAHQSSDNFHSSSIVLHVYSFALENIYQNISTFLSSQCYGFTHC